MGLTYPQNYRQTILKSAMIRVYEKDTRKARRCSRVCYPFRFVGSLVVFCD